VNKDNTVSFEGIVYQIIRTATHRLITYRLSPSWIFQYPKREIAVLCAWVSGNNIAMPATNNKIDRMIFSTVPSKECAINPRPDKGHGCIQPTKENRQQPRHRPDLPKDKGSHQGANQQNELAGGGNCVHRHAQKDKRCHIKVATTPSAHDHSHSKRKNDGDNHPDMHRYYFLAP